MTKQFHSQEFNQKKLKHTAHKKTHRRTFFMASSFTHNSQKQGEKIQMSINKIMDKQSAVKHNIIQQQNRMNH